MGKRSRRHRRAERHDASTTGARPRALDATAVTEGFSIAAELWAVDAHRSRTIVDILADQWERGPTVAEVADVMLSTALADARSRGWESAELIRVVNRRAGKAAAQAVSAVIDAENRWAEQARLAPADAVAAIVGALGMLVRLPDLPRTREPTSSSIDTKVLARVRALLAKAESTTFPDEAEALTEKAQQLMARHAIDRAMLADGRDDQPTSVRIGVDDPYASAKSLLLAAVATATRCQAVWSKELGFTTVFGFSSDLAAVELLYTSLLVQSTTAMGAAGRTGGPRARSRGFRSSFLVAFARRIGCRLIEATKTTVEEADIDHSGALLPVLARRDAAVEAARDEAFPHLKTAKVSASDSAGWAAGTTAADLAALGGDAVPTGASRQSLRPG